MRQLLLIFFIALSLKISAQSAGFKSMLVLTHLTEENGLSDNHVKCVFKDDDGLVWIGTSDGLNLLDGSSLQVFRHADKDSNSIGANNITCIAPGANGRIFFGTGQGISWYNSKKRNFNSIGQPQSPYGVAGVVVNICLDKNKRIWCATDGGLFLFDPIRQNFTAYYNQNAEQQTTVKYANKLKAMIVDRNGIFWIASGDGLWTFNPVTYQYKKIIHRNNDAFYDPLCLSVYEDHEQNIWAGFWNVGLKKYDTHTGKLFDYGSKLNHSYNVYCINEVKLASGKYILWLNGKLVAFNPSDSSYFNFEPPANEKDFPEVYPVYQSKDGWVWLTGNRGLYIYNPQKQLFSHENFPGAITSQGILFHSYKNGLLVAGQGNDFLKLTTLDGKLIKDYSYLGADHRGAVLAMVEDKPGDFWIGSTDGILHANPETGYSKWFRHDDKDSNSLPRYFINAIFIDSKNQCWIFPWRSGVWQLDRTTGKCTKMIRGFSTDIDGSIKGLLINDAMEDANGNIWMTDLDEGIILYNAATKQFTKPFAKQIADRFTATRLFKKDRYIYSKVGNGIVKWDIDHYNVQKIYLPPEINKELVDMYPDQSGNWWLTAHNGLIAFNESAGIFKRFTSADGLLENDIDAGLFCMTDGNMIIGDPHYFSVFNPTQLLKNSFEKKQMLLTELLVNNKAIEIDQERINLDYNENNIQLRWAIPDYSNPLRNQYYVKIEGLDTGWRYIGNTGFVQYANLSPGSYKIHLKAATANGTPAANTIALHFVIKPPFWKTWWFWLLLFLSVGFALYWTINRHIKKLQRDAALQQQLSDLEMKALRAQMNPHFIFNSLNSIQECIVSKNTDAAYTYLAQFSKLVRRILENSGKATVPLKEELELMQWYLSLEQLRFTDEFNFSISNDVNPQVEIPSMIIQPFIENALWHGLAQKSGEKLLQLDVKDAGANIHIIITDNGIGRKAAAALPKRPDKQSMGLDISKERLHNYSAVSSVEIIDLLDAQATAAGTKVIIHLPYN